MRDEKPFAPLVKPVDVLIHKYVPLGEYYNDDFSSLPPGSSARCSKGQEVAGKYCSPCDADWHGRSPQLGRRFHAVSGVLRACIVIVGSLHTWAPVEEQKAVREGLSSTRTLSTTPRWCWTS